jgi:hypothetical protein
MKNKLVLIIVVLFCFLSKAQLQPLSHFSFIAGSLNDISPNHFTASTVDRVSTAYDCYYMNPSRYRFVNSCDYLSKDCYSVSSENNRTINFWARIQLAGTNSAGVHYGGGQLGEEFNLFFNSTTTPDTWLPDISDETREWGLTFEDDKWQMYTVSFDNGILISTPQGVHYQ